MVVTRMTTAMTMPLGMSEYRFCTQAEQQPSRKGKDPQAGHFLLSLGEQLGLRHNPRPGDSHHEFDFANHVQPFLFVYTEESVPWKVSKS